MDDDPGIRELLAIALQDEGYEVQTAAHGAEALEILERWPARLILLDLMMPVMDGWAFRARQLEIEAVSRIPVLVLSAGAALQRHAAKLGAASVFEKPFDLGALLAVVKQLAQRNETA